MNIYSLIKKVNNINSPRLKLFGLFLLHIFKKRYLGIFFDPVLACNLRCKMCYFSDETARKNLKGVFQFEDIEKISKALFHRALKLQIGCGAEPTLYKQLPDVIALAKKKKVPYVSITTNGNLLTKELTEACLQAGLDEITISLHGVNKEIYEFFMTNGSYEKFCENLKILSDMKEKYPYKLRINFTMNQNNIEDLGYFFEKFGDIRLDVLQLRPIEKIGESEYKEFSHEKISQLYNNVILKIKKEAEARNIICIAPTKNQIDIPEGNNKQAVIFDAAYCYVSPKVCWQDDFDFNSDTFESYSKNHHYTKRLLKEVFQSKNSMVKRKKYLNYKLS